MADSPTLLEIGRITKPHGLTGEVAVALVTNRTERLDVGSELVTAEGRTLVVEKSRKANDRYLVYFAGVGTREAADALRSVTLLAEPIDDPDELWAHELIGSLVVEADGTERGEVVAVQENPASDLLVLESGLLVPLIFVTSAADGRIEIDAPAGLFDEQ